jgi:asparagine synthase (glutamine-hydrolysing)
MLKGMANVINHRGPDDRGLWIDGPVGLAHQRLAIIDPEGGNQPMFSGSGRYVITYNGELYNYRELSDDELGDYTFGTSCDTEVVLAAFEKWGKSCVNHFNGIFAFAVWDREEKTLFLARDHYGVKPLYYTNSEKRFIFASEIKSILKADSSLASLDMRQLNTLLTYRYSPSPGTLFKDIYKLRPGHYMEVRNGAIIEDRYFWPKTGNLNLSESEIEKDAGKRLDKAIKRQLVSDVPVGLLLSGGVDSSLLATLAAQYYGPSLTAYTAGFEGRYNVDETMAARKTAASLGIRHETIELGKENFLSIVNDMVWHLEEPVATTSAVPFYALCKEIGKSHKVVLSGQGVDELFGGYFRHLAEKASGGLRRLFSSKVLSNIASTMAPRNSQIDRAFRSLGERDDQTRFLKIFSLFNEDLRHEILINSYDDDTGYLDYYQSDVSRADPLTKMLYYEMRTSLPDDLLLYTDKVSMASSVEVRVPYLDRDFAEYIERLGPEMKIRGLSRKHLFRKLAGKHLPKEVLSRGKLGFETPVNVWLKEGLNDSVRDIISSPRSFSSGVFRKGAVERMLDEHKDGRADYSRHLYMVLLLEFWSENFGVKV